MDKKSSLIMANKIGDVMVVNFLTSQVLDEMNVQQLGSELDALLEKEYANKMVINFSKIKFLSSAVLGKLISLNKKIGDKSDEAKSTADEDLMKEAESLQTAGKVMVGLTAASLATAVVLLFFTDFKGGEEEPLPETAWRIDGVSPILTGDGGGLALCGRF